MAPRRGLRFGLGVLLMLGLIGIVRPWTIRPIQTAPTAAFDASSYVESSWPRVLAEAHESARDVAAVLQTSPSGASAAGRPASRQSVFVKGTGVVTSLDLESRAGQALVRVEQPGPHVTVAMQVGPVLRGTALRDAVSFIRFTDFANQSDFAAVSTALNERVLSAVLGPIDRQALSGQRVSFVGAATLRQQDTGTTLVIVPVTLGVSGGHR